MTTRLVGAAAVCLTAVLIPTTTASAAPATAAAKISTLYLYYNSTLQGAYQAIPYSNPNLSGIYYTESPSSLAGYGQHVKNNAASAENRASFTDAIIYYNSNYAGACDYVSAGATVNRLAKTYNNDASVFMTAPISPGSCYYW